MKKNKVVMLSVFVMSLFSLPAHSQTHSRTVTVWGWGGPETDLRCDKMVNWGLLGKHCVAHSVIHKQHRITLTMTAPTNIDVNQVVGVKDACKASADVVALATWGNIGAALATLEACVQSTNLGAHLIRSGARFNVGHEAHW